MLNLPQSMIRACRQKLFQWKVADSTGDQLTGGQFLLKTLVLRRLLLREVLAEDEKYVGLLLPPSNGAAIVNNALAVMGRVSVNLNYSVSASVLNSCIRRADIRHVLTSERVLDKLGLDAEKDIDADVFLLENLRDKVTLADKLSAAAMAFATPAGVLDRMLALRDIQPDDELTVIFTSGSTGEPKGVVLTHENVHSNVRAIQEVVHLQADDVILGILPFFHSFGYTVTLWGPLALPPKVAYHFSPLDAKQVGKLARKHGATILLATPTFLRSYLRRCDKDDFAKMEIVVAGAEKLPHSLSDAFEEKFGVRPIEGYGATELSPLVSVNVPPTRSHTDRIDLREGTVGQCVPGVRAKIVHPETGQELSTDEEGLLLIAGPNLMKGYLHDEAKTSEVVHDGWYVTGDVAKLDAEGFIHITGRESRFSKIGGEMVPHVLVEEAIQEFLSGGKDDEPMAVVTSAPCGRKGEQLVVVHLPLEKTPEQISAHLKAEGLPNLWIPGNENYMQVEELPLLGSGKLDLKALAKIAKDRFGEAA